MNPELDKYLCDKYPLIFVERSKSPRESCMGRGFECGNGWFPIINTLCHNIQQRIDTHNKYLQEGQSPIPQFVALQVKEKFGALRIYSQGGDAYCQGMVSMAEAWSWSTCENCSAGGERLVGHTTGWIGSLCAVCAKKEKRTIKFHDEVKDLLETAIEKDSEEK